jgi:hypothetical protein
VASACERGNEPLGSMKCWEIMEWLHNLWPLEWYSAPQGQSVGRSHIFTNDLCAGRIVFKYICGDGC